jgi:NAD(P)-dependent dehydrogenase (short-subunit alcohol dehydrogenase family)
VTRGWTENDAPDQHGRVAVVTGANTGVGRETARLLAARGAAVIMGCRDVGKGAAAAAWIRAAVPDADVQVCELDLASLASVRAAAERIGAGADKVDLLVNNAGVMWAPRGRTEDGFETQFGTNHLGHFALTGLLLDAMRKVPGSRVVTVSSVGHRGATLDLDDLNCEHGTYHAQAQYGRTKLANLLFSYELQRRLAAAGAETAALAAHPGVVHTELVRHTGPLLGIAVRAVTLAIGQRSPYFGALPSLRAATDPAAKPGEYYGPGGRFEGRGHPRVVQSSAESHDAATAGRLWQESERLTGISYHL